MTYIRHELQQTIIQTNKFCVYGLLCPLRMQIKYIGCTKNIKSRIPCHQAANGTQRKVNWIGKLRALRLLPIPVILKQFSEEGDALIYESRLIKKHLKSLYNGSPNKRIRFTNKAIAAIKEAPQLILTLAIYNERNEATIRRWLKKNDVRLTALANIEIIQKETKLLRNEIVN